MSQTGERGPTIGSLCSGIGGLELGLERAGLGRVVWHSEIEPHASTVLERHWPGVPNIGDVREVNWLDDSLDYGDGIARSLQVDILTAGYPCQPFSHAGRRKGTDDERHLWPVIRDSIRDLRPGLVILENVRAHLSLGFGDVLGDLARLGFNAEWRVLRASDVGAPHQRARLFAVAYPDGTGIQGPQHRAHELDGRAAPDPESVGPQRDVGPPRGRGPRPTDNGRASTPDPDGQRREPRRTPIGALPEPRPVERPRRRDSRSLRGATPDPDVPRLEGREPTEGRTMPTRSDPPPPRDWGRFTGAIRRWETLTRPAPAPTVTSPHYLRNLERRKAGTHPLPVGMRGSLKPRGMLASPFVEWMMGFPEGWTDDLGRVPALHALGNAVVPQVAETFGRMILDRQTER